MSYDKLQQLGQLNKRCPSCSPKVATPPAALSRRGVGNLDREYSYLCPELRRKRMIPVVVRICARDPESFEELVHHSGEEFIYVLEGRVAIHTEF